MPQISSGFISIAIIRFLILLSTATRLLSPTLHFHSFTWLHFRYPSAFNHSLTSSPSLFNQLELAVMESRPCFKLMENLEVWKKGTGVSVSNRTTPMISREALTSLSAKKALTSAESFSPDNSLKEYSRKKQR